jgi:glycosyltransferase involved in cell wall biosynthesis
MNKKPSATFILSGPGHLPVGGFRIIYEYANRLTLRGWKITVVHSFNFNQTENSAFLKKIKKWASFFKNKLLRTYTPRFWFPMNGKVSLQLVPNLGEKYIPDADYIIACPSQTATIVSAYSVKKGKKIYFIQGFEYWAMPVNELENTWRLPMKKIVISRWLQKKLEAVHERSICIQNGLDFNQFKIDNPFFNRKTNSVLFLSHFLELKGTKYALDAITILKRKYPTLHAAAFGIIEKPSSFPDFIEYHRNPSQKKICSLYNASRIFIASSISEGWGLTACEAMMCGCAVVATDIPGHREFLIDGENGIFCRPGSTDSIIEKVEWILSNEVRAEKMASKAPQTLKKFDWDSRITLFEDALLTD